MLALHLPSHPAPSSMEKKICGATHMHRDGPEVKGHHDNVRLVSTGNIRLEEKVPEKIWEQGSSQLNFKVLFLFPFYSCFSALPPWQLP